MWVGSISELLSLLESLIIKLKNVIFAFNLRLKPTKAFYYASAQARAVAGGIVFSGSPSVRLSHSRERNISLTPWRNFFKFGTNVHLDIN